MKFLFLGGLLLIYLSLGGWLYQKMGTAGILLSQIGVLGLPAWLLSKKLALKLSVKVLQRLPTFKEGCWVVLLTTLVIFIIERLTYWQSLVWPLPPELKVFYNQLTTPSFGISGLLQFISVVLAPAICEEIFFRGWIQTSLEEYFTSLQANKPSQIMAIFITAFIFAIAHLNPWYAVQYFLLGIFLSVLKSWRGQISFCILAHFLNNFISVYGF